MVAQALGEPSTPKGWNSWRAYTWTHGNLTITRLTGGGNYLPGDHRFNQIQALVVTVGPHQVCYHRATTDGEPADNFFVPGDWTQVVKSHLTQAHQALADRQAAGRDGERRQLEQQLLIGQDCTCTLDQHCPICDAAAAKVYGDEPEADESDHETIPYEFTQEELDNMARTEVWNNPSVKDQLWEVHND